MFLQWVVLAWMLISSVVLLALLALSYLPSWAAKPVLNLVRSQKVMLVFKISFVVMLLILIMGYFDMRGAEDRYYNVADNATHSMKLNYMSQKFRTERNVYLYACSCLILLMILRFSGVLNDLANALDNNKATNAPPADSTEPVDEDTKKTQ
eukprot:TRINITY_DN2153_c0_g1_i1.p1 TRINITY_DN2153_c0_g1~~TRINITY_DN2153_c0_g1_i1.p1  ORF type:complete len:167 (+),score=53.69 TRINITY_DN2153_c0_g1_i1:47-502(+)